MPFMEWNDSFSVGVHKIDEQHKKLIAITADLYQAMSEGKSKEIMGTILQELVEYTKTHFRDEEALMEKVGYEELSLHKQEHGMFVDKAAGYLKEFIAGKPVVSIDLLEFLRDWLIGHIQGTDKKYSPLMKEKGIA